MVRTKREQRITERRAFERYTCRVQLAPNVELVDVSEAGAQLECSWNVPLGAVVSLPLDRLLPATTPLRVAYQVVHVRQLPETGRHRIHGRFLDTPSSALETFRSAVRRMNLTPSS